MSDATPTVSLLCITTAIATFTTVMPDISEVRKASKDSDLVNDVRVGEVSASVLMVGIGLVASSLTKSPVPAMFTIVAVVLLVLVYETVLQADLRGIATK